MNSAGNFLQPALRRALATAAFAVICGVSLSAMAQPSGASGQGPGPGWQGAGMRHGMGPGMGGGFGMMDGRGMDRALDAVNASADQKARIRQIMQAARTDLAAQRDARRTLHEQMQAIFAAPTIDARAAEALRQQMFAQHDAASKRMMQAMLDAAQVLTPEQRKALADRRAQRQAMMLRHRSERQSLDAAPRKP